ncbi:hypothetical protein QJQ45_022931 [Haematococcus lacustris]|nr:hypothetical protein QJQ45_022931 [Haematococcus lacustris]
MLIVVVMMLAVMVVVVVDLGQGLGGSEVNLVAYPPSDGCDVFTRALARTVAPACPCFGPGSGTLYAYHSISAATAERLRVGAVQQTPVREAAAAAAAGGLTGTSPVATAPSPQRVPKRQRVTEHPPAPLQQQQQQEVEVKEAEETAGTSHPVPPAIAQESRSQGRGQGQGSSASDVLPPHTAFELLRVRGLAAGSNQGCLGRCLADLVAGPMQLVLAMNYMVDIAWLLSACPDLVAAQQLVLCTGDARAQANAAYLQALGLGPERCLCHSPPLPLSWGTHHTKALIIQPGGMAAEVLGSASRGAGLANLASALEVPHDCLLPDDVLQYQEGLRVVVSTANFIHCDCTAKTQGMWDFPWKDAASPSSSDFEASLTDYLAAMQLPLPLFAVLPCTQWRYRVAKVVAQADMSSARAFLVPSVPGRHSGAALAKFGHMRLRALLRQEPWFPPIVVPAAPVHSPSSANAASRPSTPEAAARSSGGVVLQCSSQGRLTPAWLLQEFGGSLTACAPPGSLPQAQHDTTQPQSQHEHHSMTQPSQSQSQPAPQQQAGPLLAGGPGIRQESGLGAWRQPPLPSSQAAQNKVGAGGHQAVRPVPLPLCLSQLHLVWPTVQVLWQWWLQEVRDSLEGWAAGGSIPGKAANIQSSLVRPLYSRLDLQALGRQRAMPHIKTYCRFEQGGRLAWVLLTSHNMSKPAWGELVQGGNQLLVRSYELGVLTTPTSLARYFAHRHCGFSCAPGSAPPAPQLPATKDVAVELWGWQAWRRCQATDPEDLEFIASRNPTAIQVFAPLPFGFPPTRYATDADRAWAADEAHSGVDAMGLTEDDYRGRSAYGHVETA